MKPKYIPLSPISRILSDCGAPMISDTAINEIANRTEKYAIVLSKKAIILAAKDGSKNVTRDHVLRALGIEQAREQGNEGFDENPEGSSKKRKKVAITNDESATAAPNAPLATDTRRAV